MSQAESLCPSCHAAVLASSAKPGGEEVVCTKCGVAIRSKPAPHTAMDSPSTSKTPIKSVRKREPLPWRKPQKCKPAEPMLVRVRLILAFCSAFAILALLVLIGTCREWSAFFEGNGIRLRLPNGGEVYYTSRVDEADASRLGHALVREQYFDGPRKTVQLDRRDGIYRVRCVLQSGVDKNPNTVDLSLGSPLNYQRSFSMGPRSKFTCAMNI